MIAGTIDRLLVTPEALTLIDFKTTRRPPETVAGMPVGTIRQLAAYAAALEVIYPDRAVHAGVLYTHAPQLMPIPADLLEAHKRELQGAQ